MTPGMDQTEEDVDALEEQLEALDPDTDVRVSWGSSRANSAVTIEGTTLEHDSALAYVRTDERKSDFGFRRRGPREIAVTAISGNRNESTGWLVDVEVLDEDDQEDVVDDPEQRDLEGNPTGQATLNVEGDDV